MIGTTTTQRARVAAEKDERLEKKSRFGNFGTGVSTGGANSSGINSEIWGPLSFGGSRISTNRGDELRGSSALQQSSIPDSNSLARPSSSNNAAWAANGASTNFNPASGAHSPLRQRTAQTARSNSPLAGQAGTAGATSQMRLNPETSIFNPGNTYSDYFSATGPASRASSTHRSASVARAGYNNDFAGHMNGFNPHAAFGSHSASRNGSYPPSRHGHDISPTDASFNMNEVNERLPRNNQMFDGFDRPQSQGQSRPYYFGSVPADRRPSAPFINSGLGNSFGGFDPAADSRSVRTGSVSSNIGAPSFAMVPQAETFRIKDQSTGGTDLPDLGSMSLSLHMQGDFPVLSNSNNIHRTGTAPMMPSSNNAYNPNQLRQNQSRLGQSQSQQRRPAYQPNHYTYPTAEQMYRNQLNAQAAQAGVYNGNMLHADSHQMSSAQRFASQQQQQQQQQQYYTSDMAARSYFQPNMNPTAHAARGPSRNAKPTRADEPPPKVKLTGNHWVQKERYTGSTFIEATAECRVRDIIDHVPLFCGDQSGSRLIQEMIETCNNEDKEAIFRELLPNAIQLCLDPFANYVIQKFFEYGMQRQKEALAAKMKGKILYLSKHSFGCRSVQKAFEHILHAQQLELVEELKSCLHEVARDQHGNHVIQKVLQSMDAKDVQFILNGFEGHVVQMSNDMYACRVIQRLLDYGDEYSKPSTTAEIVGNAYDLMRSPYGNYVIQHVVEHGTAPDRAAIVDIVEMHVPELMVNKFASNVIERCLERGTEQQQDRLVGKISEVDLETGEPKYLREAMTAPYANYVVQRTLKTLGPGKWEPFAELVESQMQYTNNDRGCKKYLEFERLLKQGPYGPDGEPLSKVRFPKTKPALHRSNTDTGSQGTGTPPPLTRTGPSPLSSNAPSTSNSMIDGPTGSVNSASGSHKSGGTVVGGHQASALTAA